MTLAIAAAAIALAAYLFFRKLRPARVAVPSLLLWSRVLADPREMTLWDRIRRAVSLVVTCALAGALALAIGDPRRFASPREGDGTRLLVVLDSSWSMAARASGGTRWDRAVSEARRLAAGAGGEVAIATTSDGLVEGPTADRAAIETALDRLAPGGTPGAWPDLDGATAVHFITDGSASRPADHAVIVHSVHEAAANVAITAFDVRMRPDGQSEIYLEAANFGPRRETRISVRRGAAVLFERAATIEEGQSIRHVLPIPTIGEPRLTARIDASGDALAIDNEAFAWTTGAAPLTVTVVGSQIGWLARLLGQDPRVRARFVAPADFQERDADVVIFDEWAPPVPPSKPAILFHPPVDTAWLHDASVGGASAEVADPRWIAAGSHAVVRGVDPLTLSITRAARYAGAGLMPVATSTASQPLIAVRDDANAARLVVVAFGSRGSNLAAAPAFPVLIGNALDWVSGRDDVPSRRAGLATFDSAIQRLLDPAGQPVPLLRLPGETLATLRAPGFYSVERRGITTSFAVNVNSPSISNLRRGPERGTADGIVAAGLVRGRPWWIYLAGFAFAAAIVEWWTWLRRITV